MKPKLTHDEEKIKDLLHRDPREKLLALTFMKDWTLGDMCNFLDKIRRPGTWRNSECTLIVLSMFSEELVDRIAWRGWRAIVSYSVLPWNKDKIPDKFGVLHRDQLFYSFNAQTTISLFKLRGYQLHTMTDDPFDLFKEVR
jgi:hypothetical protein